MKCTGFVNKQKLSFMKSWSITKKETFIYTFLFFRSKVLLNMTKKEPKNPLSSHHEIQKIWIKEKICHSAGNMHSDIDILQQKLILYEVKVKTDEIPRVHIFTELSHI